MRQIDVLSSNQSCGNRDSCDADNENIEVKLRILKKATDPALHEEAVLNREIHARDQHEEHETDIDKYRNQHYLLNSSTQPRVGATASDKFFLKESFPENGIGRIMLATVKSIARQI